MSYTNGIGTQQPVDAQETSASASASRTAESSTSSVRTAANGSSSGLGVDNATLSSTASVVSQALSGSDVRFEKVAALQQQIAAGTYNVSSSDVADKLLSSLLK